MPEKRKKYNMGYIALVVVIILTIGGLVFWNSHIKGGIGGEISNFSNITPADAKEKLAAEDVILLDVRTKEEYLAKHIPESTLIPLNVLEKEAPQRIPDKDKAIIVYCRSGNRSLTASKILSKMGYTQVFNLGGINQWPYKTETGQ